MGGDVQDLRFVSERGLRHGFRVAGSLIDGPQHRGNPSTVDHVGDVGRKVDRRREAGERRLQVSEVGDQRGDDRVEPDGGGRAHGGPQRPLRFQVGAGNDQVQPSGAVVDVDVDPDASRKIRGNTDLLGGQDFLQPFDQPAFIQLRARVDRPLGDTQPHGRNTRDKQGSTCHGRSERIHVAIMPDILESYVWSAEYASVTSSHGCT